MNREQFLKSIESTYTSGIELIKLKNQDYAGDSDPFRNFRSASVIGLTVEQGILIRMLDKLARIGNLLDRKEVVLDESLTDSLRDIANYAAILKAYREQK